MSDSEEQATSEHTGNAAVNDGWREKLKRFWLSTRMAHEGMMLDKLQRQNRIVENSVRKLHGFPLAEEEEADEMAVRIGDEVTNYYGAPPVGNTTGLSTLAKVAVAGASLLGAGGLGAAANAYLHPPAAPAIDTDTQAVGGFKILKEPPAQE